MKDMTQEQIYLLKDLVPLTRMILPLPRRNGTVPGRNMGLDDKLGDSNLGVQMTNVILKHTRVQRRKAAASAFFLL